MYYLSVNWNAVDSYHRSGYLWEDRVPCCLHWLRKLVCIDGPRTRSFDTGWSTERATMTTWCSVPWPRVPSRPPRSWCTRCGRKWRVGRRSPSPSCPSGYRTTTTFTTGTGQDAFNVCIVYFIRFSVFQDGSHFSGKLGTRPVADRWKFWTAGNRYKSGDKIP